MVRVLPSKAVTMISHSPALTPVILHSARSTVATLSSVDSKDSVLIILRVSQETLLVCPFLSYIDFLPTFHLPASFSQV